MNPQKCNRKLYRSFLLSTINRYSSASLAEVSPIKLSHDSASNWLKTKVIQPSEILKEAQAYIKPNATGTLIIDDTLLLKKYGKEIELVSKQYSGSEHAIEYGIGLVNMAWQESNVDIGCIPVDYRIYDNKTDGKTKNDHAQDMLKLAKQRGLKIENVVMDCWYSGLENLKLIRALDWYWTTNMRKNRIVNQGVSLADLNIPDEGLNIHLRGYGLVKVFKFVDKDGHIDYLTTSNLNATRTYIEQCRKTRWQIEVIHRELKQTCGISRCQSRTGRAQRNHIAMAFLTWFDRQKQRVWKGLSFYKQIWQSFKKVIKKRMQVVLASP